MEVLLLCLNGFCCIVLALVVIVTVLALLGFAIYFYGELSDGFDGTTMCIHAIFLLVTGLLALTDYLNRL